MIKNTLKINIDLSTATKYDKLIGNLSKNMYGRICEAPAVHILPIIKDYMGDKCKVYVETGSLFGGSLILLMQDETPCEFIGIDLFDGYYDKDIDPVSKLTLCVDDVHKNIEKYNKHEHKYTLIKGSSYDLNTVEKFRSLGKSIDLLFIDGDHSEIGVLGDYNSYKEFVNKDGLIMFDNYESCWKEVKPTVDSIDFENDGFQKIGQYGQALIVKKK